MRTSCTLRLESVRPGIGPFSTKTLRGTLQAKIQRYKQDKRGGRKPETSHVLTAHEEGGYTISVFDPESFACLIYVEMCVCVCHVGCPKTPSMST